MSYIYEQYKNGGAVMKVSEVLEKANRGEGLTVEEIEIHNANVKEKRHVYGK